MNTLTAELVRNQPQTGELQGVIFAEKIIPLPLFFTNKLFSSVPPDWEKYKKIDYLFGSVKNVSSWLPTKDETLMKT